ncbi:MAG: TonB-dependent receptor [Treponema sp.]|jgi:vitamin B12 transporter|nr:TonB-dependent receptor [Treponema sp.]
MKKTAGIAIAVLFSLVSLYSQENNDYHDGDFSDFGESPRDVSITGTAETTQQITVIDKETIEKSGARDLAALLEEEIDMSVTRYGGYGNQTSMNLRGFDTERIAILIDGVPANSPRSGQFDISQIDLDNVERIEVIYGGSDTKYNVSGAMGGVINIITIKKQKTGLNLGFTLSNTGYMPGRYNKRHAGGAIGEPEYIDLLDMQSLNFFAGYGAEKFSWKASLFGNSAGNHYLYKDNYGFARRKISNEVLDGGGNAQFMFVLPKDASILSDTKMYYAHRNFPITPDSVGSALATDLLITENVMFAAPVIFHDDIATEASLTYQTSITTFGSDYSSGNDHYLTGINRWSWFPAENFTLRSGIDWRFLYINSDSPTETNPVKTGNQGGLYVTGEYKIHKNLLLVASVKGVTDTKQAAAVPKIGLSWKVHPQFTLKNNYFRSFKFPDFDDLYYRSMDNMFAGNPNLKPEDGWGADIIGELKLEKYFSFISTAFWQWTTDSIHWVKQGGRWSPENIATACFTGADFRPVFTLPIKKGSFTSLKIVANYQFQFSWLLNDDLDFADSFRIPYMPTHIIGGSVDLAWKTGSFFVSAHYETTRYADTMNQIPLDPYCVLHATVNQKAGKYLTLFGSLRNILNAQYESFAGYYMPGISLVIGARTKFDFSEKNKFTADEELK